MTFDRGDQIMAAIRVSTTDMQGLVKQVRQRYATFAEGSPLPFDYSFMDEDFNAMYRSEGTIGHIFAIFTSLAVLVACLGLFGLVVFSAEQRSKELSIRKVLGATAGDIIVLLARDYVLLILLSLTLAFPLAWWGGQRWLETFTDRTSIDGWTFFLAAGTILLAVALTVSWQAFRSATANPVDNLKAE
jgi:putative ABC transport system permease protein